MQIKLYMIKLNKKCTYCNIKKNKCPPFNTKKAFIILNR